MHFGYKALFATEIKKYNTYLSTLYFGIDV